MLIDQEENSTERPSSVIDTKLETNEDMMEILDGSGFSEWKKATALLPHSPLATAKIDQLTNFEFSPYTQTPGSTHPPEFSAFWSVPPPPGPRWARQVYAYPYPPSAFHPPRSVTEMGKSVGSHHPSRSGATTDKEGNKPHPYQPYPPHQGYDMPYPYPPPYYPRHPKSPGVTPLSPFPPCPSPRHYHAGAPYTYPYMPPSEALGIDKQRHSHAMISGDASSDEQKEDRPIMPTDLTLTSPVPTFASARNVTDEAKQRRDRKNALSRVRAQRKREQIDSIRAKPEWQRSEEESELLRQFDNVRDSKNVRSRERARETKRIMDAILQKPQKLRTAREVQFLDMHLYKKSRKNEGDKMRRGRLKALGWTPTTKAPHIRVTARGPLPGELNSAHLARAGDPPLPCAYPYSPALNGYSHRPIPSPFIAAGGTSFTTANGKASVDFPVEQP